MIISALLHYVGSIKHRFRGRDDVRGLGQESTILACMSK